MSQLLLSFQFLLLDDIRVVVECLIKLQLLHLLPVLDFLVFRDSILVKLLTEIVVVGKLANLLFFAIIGIFGLI